MRTLILFYSRTGITKKVVNEIKTIINCDVDEIIDKKDRDGAIGYLFAGRDTLLKRTTEIEQHKDPRNYDIIFIGTPVWVNDMSVPIRAYIYNNKEFMQNAKKIALFCTHGGSGDKSTFLSMEKMLEKKAIASLSLTTKEIVHSLYAKKVLEFVKSVMNNKID